MQEIEARFLNISIKDTRKKLRDIGARRVHKPLLFERYVFELPDSNIKGFVRIRSEGKKITSTIKIYKPNTNYPLEYELTLKNTLDEAKSYLEALGLKIKSYQQTIREKWRIDNCKELVIDTVPGLPTYIEIECDSEKDLKDKIKKMNFDIKNATYGPYGRLFESYYGIPEKEFNQHVSSLTFKNIIKELHMIKKNKKMLLRLKDKHIKLFEHAKENLKNLLKK